MNVLIVNNTVFCECQEGLCVQKDTGRFFVEMQELGHSVHVLQMSMKKGYSYPAGTNFGFNASYDIRNKGLRIWEIKRRRSSYWAYVRMLIKGVMILRKMDFVYLFYPGRACTALALMSLICSKKFGLYLRGEQGCMSRMAKFLYRRATVIFTICPDFTEMVNKTGNLAYTIRPMMEFREEDIVVDRHYHQKEKYRLLFVGRIEREKGVFELIDAAKILVEQNIRNIEVHLVGDGVDALSFGNAVRTARLDEYFTCHGTVTDRSLLARHYKDADLFVLPTHHEGFPRVLYEAMVFGVPIVTSFVGGIPFLMKDEVNSYRILPKDPEKLAETIKSIILNYDKKALVARNATLTIEAVLYERKEKHAQQLTRLLRELLPS